MVERQSDMNINGIGKRIEIASNMLDSMKKELEPLNQGLVKLSGNYYQIFKAVPAFPTDVEICPEEYALMEDAIEIDEGMVNYQTSFAISMFQRFNGKNYTYVNLESLKDGLFVPPPSKFMPHLRNVNDALNGKGVLYDAHGSLIDGVRLRKYAHELNRKSEVWLNAGFSKGKGFKGLNLVTITGVDENRKPVLSAVPLEKCMEKDGWADMESLNDQGLPTEESPVRSFEPGKTFYFWSPVQDAVTGFGAISDSGGADLDCSRTPDGCRGTFGSFTAVSVSVDPKKYGKR